MSTLTNMNSRDTLVTHMQRPSTLVKPYISFEEIWDDKREHVHFTSTRRSLMKRLQTVSIAYVVVQILVILIIIVIDSLSVSCYTLRFAENITIHKLDYTHSF